MVVDMSFHSYISRVLSLRSEYFYSIITKRKNRVLSLLTWVCYDSIFDVLITTKTINYDNFNFHLRR